MQNTKPIAIRKKNPICFMHVSWTSRWSATGGTPDVPVVSTGETPATPTSAFQLLGHKHKRHCGVGRLPLDVEILCRRP